MDDEIIPGFEDIDTPIPGFEDIDSQPTIDHPENILQRASKAMQQAYNSTPLSAYGKVMGAKNKFLDPMLREDQLLNESMPEVIPGTKGIQNAMHGATNWLTRNVFTDPLNYMAAEGITKVGSSAVRGIGKVGRSVFNPSKVYGEALDSSKGKVNFLDVIYKHSDDPAVKKVLEKSGVIEKYGGTSLGEGGSVTEKLSNLSQRQAQNLINDVKVGESRAMLSGDVVKSNKVGLSKFFSDLSRAQGQADPSMKGAKALYGFSKGIKKVGKDLSKKAVSGAEWGAVGYPVYKALSGK